MYNPISHAHATLSGREGNGKGRGNGFRPARREKRTAEPTPREGPVHLASLTHFPSRDPAVFHPIFLAGRGKGREPATFFPDPLSLHRFPASFFEGRGEGERGEKRPGDL